MVSRLVRNALRAPEREEVGAKRVEGCQSRGNQRDDEQQSVEVQTNGSGESDVEDFVLAPETGKQRHASQSSRAAQECPVGSLEQSAQAAEATHINHATHGVHDTAGAEKQKSLEEGMGEQVKDGSDDGKLCQVAHAAAQSEKHVAKLADRGVGQHTL